MRSKPVITISFVLLSLLLQPAVAQIYMWKDDNGLTHYTDQAPRQVKKSKPKKIRILQSNGTYLSEQALGNEVTVKKVKANTATKDSIKENTENTVNANKGVAEALEKATALSKMLPLSSTLLNKPEKLPQ